MHNMPIIKCIYLSICPTFHYLMTSIYLPYFLIPFPTFPLPHSFILTSSLCLLDGKAPVQLVKARVQAVYMGNINKHSKLTIKECPILRF